MKSKFYLLAGLAAICGMLNVAHADATWTVTGITGDSDVLTSGGGYQLLSALDFMNTTGTGYDAGLVNTVQFTQANTDTADNWTNNGITLTLSGTAPGVGYQTFFANPHDVSNPSFNNLSAVYQPFLAGQVAGNGANQIGFTLAGLTSGTTYTMRIWSQSSYVGSTSSIYFNTWSMVGGTNTISGISTADVAGSLGSYFDATFTATGSTASFISTSAYQPSLNAVEILEAVPEPSTVALLSVAVGLIGLTAVRRFRAVRVG